MRAARLGRSFVILAMIGSAATQAQTPAAADALTSLEKNVQKTYLAWKTLSSDLDARVARMLPCDPRGQAAIEEVSRASQSRLSAVGEYYQMASVIAATRTSGAKQLFAAEEERSQSGAVNLEEATAAAAAAEKQVADLMSTVEKQAAFGGSLAALRQATEATRQRNAVVKDEEARRRPVLETLKQLVAVYEVREAALGETLKAFEAERTRWNAYYAARLARGQIECAVTNPSAPATGAAKPRATKSGKAKAK